MIGLAGARVIVVDDQPEDAIPIITALSRKGISAAFFDANSESLPPPAGRLSGVRLAILDMNLIEGSDKSKASTTASYLGGILSPRNGPYGVLAWTNHPGLVQQFEEYVISQSEMQKPIFTVSLTKAECKIKGEFNLALVSKKIDEQLAQMGPLFLLQAWEEKCFEAASNVTNALSDLATDNGSNLEEWRTSWRSRLLSLMHAMAEAEAEKQLDGDTCLASLYSLLNPLHADQMESGVAELCTTLRQHASEILDASSGCEDEAQAKVNTMLHLSFDNVDRFTAGAIFRFQPLEKLPSWVPSTDRLLSDLAQEGHQSGTSADKLKEVCHLALIEVTPACDHAQKYVRIARFITGLLVTKAERNKFKLKKEESFFWELGPVFLDKGVPPGIYWLLFSARHMVSHDLETASRMKSYARLRSQAFGDLQAWFARHSARAGMALLKKEQKQKGKK